MSNTMFLDIDESLKMKNLLLPDKEREAFDDKLNELRKKVEEEKIGKQSILVQPAPGICVKTKTFSGEKIFVNICTSDVIQGPKDVPDDKLYQLLDEAESDFVIPINMGMDGPRMEMDKSNVPCTTFDVMINATYFKKCQEKRIFMATTILAVLHGLVKRTGIEIDCENYIILKNRTVMGKLQQHKIQYPWMQDIQNTKKLENYKPLIEMIPQPGKSVNREFCLQDSDKAQTGYIVLKQPLNDPVESLIALFNMPKTMSIDDIMVLINSDRISVTNEKTCCSHDIVLPYTVKKDSAKAYMDYNLGILRVDILVQ